MSLVEVKGRLQSDIEGSKPNRNPIFIVGGCEKGWVDFFQIDNPDPEKTSSTQLAKLIKPQYEGLVEEHAHECGSDHDIQVVVRRINEERQTDAGYEADNLVNIATQTTDG